MYRKGDIMSFNQSEYISNFNKNNYKMYQFRVKKTDIEIINRLDNIESRNSYIISLINGDINKSVYTIKKIKSIIKPILNKYGIFEIYLFGSYARGEAKDSSDVDIYCDKGNIKTLIDQGLLEEELEIALNKKVDIIFNTTNINDYFRTQIMEDMIKLC
jgi:predicted nucleotidyltransferase